MSGNLTATISDHLPQFLFAPNILSRRFDLVLSLGVTTPLITPVMEIS